MKKTSQTTIRIIALAMIIFAFSSTYAADYVPLVSLPGIGEGNTSTTLAQYIPAAFKLSIAIAAGMAFVVLTFGGVTYATSDALTGKQDGRRWITNALGGLLLVIGSYAILWTINPQILSFRLSIPSANVKKGDELQIGTGIPLNSQELMQDAEIAAELGAGGVAINGGPCVDGRVTGCTNVIGLPAFVPPTLIKLKQDCACQITITGGTEGGHVTHGVGKPIVDLRADPNLNNFLTKSTNNPPNNTIAEKLINGEQVKFVFETAGGGTGGRSSGAHWHVVIRK